MVPMGAEGVPVVVVIAPGCLVSRVLVITTAVDLFMAEWVERPYLY